MSPSGKAVYMNTVQKIDEQLRRGTGAKSRIRLIFTIGDYIYKKADEKLISKRADELGVTIQDLIDWFYTD